MMTGKGTIYGIGMRLEDAMPMLQKMRPRKVLLWFCVRFIIFPSL